MDRLRSSGVGGRDPNVLLGGGGDEAEIHPPPGRLGHELPISVLREVPFVSRGRVQQLSVLTVRPAWRRNGQSGKSPLASLETRPIRQPRRPKAETGPVV